MNDVVLMKKSHKAHMNEWKSGEEMKFVGCGIDGRMDKCRMDE